MKKILLIGDSIRLGYDDYVRESMKNIAEVYYPKENCMSSSNVLRCLHTWTDELELYEADAVHFNAGHWDTVRIYGDEPITPLDVYVDNLRRIVARIRFLFPQAKLIFATSTPVIEEEFIADYEIRYNRDVERYNAAACEALCPLGVTVNDLYSLIQDKPRQYYSDQTHFYTAAATELLGKQVAKVLCNALEMDDALLTDPDVQKYHRPHLGIPDRELFVKKGHIYVQKR